MILFFEVFKTARSTDFNWRWSKARVLYREMTNVPEFTARKQVIVNLIKRNNIHMRAHQRNRNKSKESVREPLKQWHAWTRDMLIRTSTNNPAFDGKWGSFTPENRLNVKRPVHLLSILSKHIILSKKASTNTKERSGWYSLVVAWTSSNARCRFALAQWDHTQSLLSFLGVWTNVFLMTTSKRGTRIWTCTSRKKPR